MFHEGITGWPLLVVLILIFGSAQVLALVYATRLMQPDVGLGGMDLLYPRSAASESDQLDETVRCPACNTENDVAYRFCRACVRELPGRRSPASEGEQLF